MMVSEVTVTTLQLPASFTTAQAAEHGVPRWRLYELRDEGLVVSLSRGVWRLADAPPTAHESLLAVALRAPRGIVCLVSALSFHDLTDEIPSAVDLAVARGHNRPHINDPPVHVHVFDADTFELGRERRELASGETVPIYNEVRSVIDAIRLRHQVGSDVAFHATKALVGRRRSAVKELVEVGQALRCPGPVHELLEVVLA
jgi:predicted transcriptional regulator of viral defense system